MLTIRTNEFNHLSLMNLEADLPIYINLWIQEKLDLLYNATVDSKKSVKLYLKYVTFLVVFVVVNSFDLSVM